MHHVVPPSAVTEDYLRSFRPYHTAEDLRMSSLPPLGLDPATAAAYYHPSYLTHHPFPHPAFRWAPLTLGIPGDTAGGAFGVLGGGSMIRSGHFGALHPFLPVEGSLHLAPGRGIWGFFARLSIPVSAGWMSRTACRH